MKELLMLKQSDDSRVGLSSFRQPVSAPVREVVPPKNQKDVRLSDLMRKATS